SVIGPEPDHIAFIRHDVEKLVLLKKTGNGRETLFSLSPGLHRNRQKVLVAKAEAHKNVRNRIAYPVTSDDVEGVEFPEIKCFVVIARREVGFCTVVKVSDVMDGHQVTIDCGMGQFGIFLHPVSVLSRRNHKPPCKNHDEQSQKSEKRTTPFGSPEIPSQHGNT